MKKNQILLIVLFLFLMVSIPVQAEVETPLLYVARSPYLSTQNLGSALPLVLKGNFTVEMWVRPRSTQQTYANILDFNHRTNIGMVFQQDGDNVNRFGFYIGNGSTSSGLMCTLKANEWQHVAVSRAGTWMDLRINGNVVQHTVSFTGDIYYYPNSNVTVQYNANYGRYFNGDIAGLQFYNYAKTIDSIISDSLMLTELHYNIPSDSATAGITLDKMIAPKFRKNFSIEILVKPASTQETYANILDFNHRTNVGLVIQQDGNNTNKYIFGIGNGSSSSGITYQLQPEVWQRLKFERIGSTLSLYVDNILVATQSCFDGEAYYLPDSAVTVGYNRNYGRHFSGVIGDIRLDPAPAVEYRQPGAVWIKDSPKVVFGSPNFTTTIVTNTGSYKLAATRIDISFDPNMLEVDTAVDIHGVTFAPTFGGAVNPDFSPGKLIVATFTIQGCGPGTDLPIFTVHWKAKTSGISSVQCSVVTYSDVNTNAIATAAGSGTIVQVF